MKNQIRALLLGAAVSMAVTDSSHAMSELVSLSNDPMWPHSSTPGTEIIYYVTSVGRGGAGLLEVTLTADDLPPGVTATFEPPMLRFTGNQLTEQSSVMTVHCPALMPTDCYPFSITGTAKRESITITNVVLCTIEEAASRAPTLKIDHLGDGDLKLRGHGATGRTYMIEVKEEATATTWAPLGYSTADGNGRFTFFTSTAAGIPICHYRAVLVESEPEVTE
jgi:hypothetical protein